MMPTCRTAPVRYCCTTEPLHQDHTESRASGHPSLPTHIRALSGALIFKSKVVIIQIEKALGRQGLTT